MALAGVLFVAYVAASVPLRDSALVPDYVEREVHLLGGRSLARWGNPEDRREILESLAQARYQPPYEGLRLAGEDVPLSPHHPLGMEELSALIDLKVRELEANPEAGDRSRYVFAVLRDPSRLYAMEARGYRLRDPVWKPAESDKPLAERGEPLFKGGETLDKAAIDVLLRNRVRRVAVQGVSDPIGLSLGTLLMVMAIFGALAAWLHALFFRPLCAAIGERKARTDGGVRQRSENRAAAAGLAGERLRGIVDAGHARKRRYDALRQEALAESDKIRRTTRVDVQFNMRNAQAELHRAVEDARASLTASIDELANEVVEKTLARHP